MILKRNEIWEKEGKLQIRQPNKIKYEHPEKWPQKV